MPRGDHLARRSVARHGEPLTMPSYRYKAIDGGGQFIAGELEAPGLQEALLRLKGLGYKPLETIAAGTGEKGQGFVSLSFRRSISRHQVTLFLAELALVLRAGLVLDEALQLLAGEERAALAAVARDIRSRIAGGASFADALAYHPPIFGPELVAMVRVAEASGTLDRVLASIAADRTKVERMLDKVSASLRYPAFLLVAATSVLIFFLVAVVPQFAGVIQDYNSAPGTLVSLVFGLSEGLIEYGYWIGCFVALTVLFVVLALRRPPLRRRMGAQFVRLPGLRGVLQLRRAVLFCSQLATLLSNGVTLSESLRVMLHMPGANVEGLDRVAEGVRRGGRLGPIDIQDSQRS